MTKPEYEGIWDTIHAKLANYGFILRYLKEKEYITGYGYEPWHIRYIGNPEKAKEIMAQPGMTLEVYLGAVNDRGVTVDYSSSGLYTRKDLEEAAVQVKCKFASFDGCELLSLRYAGDGCATEETLRLMNEPDEGKGYTQVAAFLCDFHTRPDLGADSSWEPDMEYPDFEWWLARTADGGWQLLNWGYQ